VGLNRVVVFGGSGRIGAYVLEEITPWFDVLNADLVEANFKTEFSKIDVLDIDSVRRAVSGADAVIHLASIDFDWRALPEKYIDVNVRGSWHVLQASAEEGVKKVVVCSSIAATGLSEIRDDWVPQYLQIDEQHENRPVDSYSVSKLLLEKMALSFVHGTDMSVLCLRPVDVIMKETFSDYTDTVLNSKKRSLYSYVTASDVAKAFHKALNTDQVYYGEFFLSASDTSQAEPTINWYQKKFGQLPDIRSPEVFQLNPRASIVSSRCAEAVLGWTPTSCFQEIQSAWLEK